jgi:hypothetical protein
VDNSRDNLLTRWRTRLKDARRTSSVVTAPEGAERLLAAEMISRLTQRVGSFGRISLPAVPTAFWGRVGATIERVPDLPALPRLSVEAVSWEG